MNKYLIESVLVPSYGGLVNAKCKIIIDEKEYNKVKNGEVIKLKKHK